MSFFSNTHQNTSHFVLEEMGDRRVWRLPYLNLNLLLINGQINFVLFAFLQETVVAQLLMSKGNALE